MFQDQLIQWDKALLLTMNGWHTPWLDSSMFLMSQTLFWLPLYCLLIYLLFRNFKKQAWLVLIAVALTLLLTNLLTAEVMKPGFARLRPSHDPSMAGLVHLVRGYSEDLYGFSSGHAANTFAVALFFWWTFRGKYPWMGLLFAWAVLVSYTRIYLGVHYPGDILAGVLLGLCCGVIGLATARLLRHRPEPGENTARPG